MFTLTRIQDGATAIMVAAQYGHLKVIEFLIAAKAQVNIQSKVRLLLACIRCIYTIIIYIQNCWTALHNASHNCHCEVVKMLLEAKADVNSKTNVSLHDVFAVYCYNYTLNHYNYMQAGNTAHDVACRNGHVQICELLFK